LLELATQLSLLVGWGSIDDLGRYFALEFMEIACFKGNCQIIILMLFSLCVIYWMIQMCCRKKILTNYAAGVSPVEKDCNECVRDKARPGTGDKNNL
jgi:hypothetical protein